MAKATIRMVAEAFCADDLCIKMARIVATPERPLSVAQVVNTLREMGWAVSGSHGKGYVVRCPEHRRGGSR